MLIEDLLIEISQRKNSLKYINNYIIDEISEHWCSFEGINGEIYNKINALLTVNELVIENMEKILISYQDEVEKKYADLLKAEL